MRYTRRGSLLTGKRMPTVRQLTLFALSLLPAIAWSGEVRVAVAANFVPTLERLAADFGERTGHRVLASSASTGKHYAQIRNGAGFDVFLAADAQRPALVEQEGLGVAGTRFTYAQGRLALWVPGEAALPAPREYLEAARFRRLAIANPRLAPYGLAAQQVLERWQFWDRLQDRLVSGENVAQATQFVATGNAQAGLVALAQVLALAPDARGAYSPIPSGLHDPIDQQALLLRDSSAARAFIEYLRSDAAVARIREAGYLVPGRP